MEPAAQRASAPAKVAQIQFAVVMEDDLIFQRRFNLRAGFQPDSVEFGIHISQRFYPHVQAEGHPERALTGPRAFQLHFIRISVHTDENLRKRNVLLSIEILRQFLVAEDLVAHQDALAGINSAKPAARQWPPAHRHVLAAVIFQQNQIVITKGHQPIRFAEVLENYVRLPVAPERERFERRGAMLIDRRVGVL